MAVSERVADALAPATLRESWAMLRGLPSRPSLRWYVTFFAISIATVVSMVGSSNLLGYSVDLINGHALPVLGSGYDAMLWLLILVGLAILAETAGRAALQWVINTLARRLSVDLRKAALTSSLRAPVPDVMELGTGNVISRITQDIDNTVRIVAMVGVRLVITILILPSSLIALMAIHWSYSLLFVLIVLVMYPSGRATLQAIPAATNIVSSTEARRNNLLLDTIRGIDTLRVLKLGAWGVKRMRSASWTAVQATADRAPIFTRLLALGSVAYGFLLIGVIAVSAYLVAHGQLSVGAGTAAVFVIVRMEVHVFNVLFFASEIQSASTSLGRAVALAQMADRTEELAQAPDCLEPPSVTVRDLTFTYPGGTAILKDFNVTLEAGTTTALVGTSGAGKSTLAGLIAGLQRPDSGAVMVGDVDTSTVADTWTTRHVALISQEVHLFAGTLGDDLRMADTTASDKALFDALGQVGLGQDTTPYHRWFPQGLNTLIGAGAEDLPPEVQQQIALARIILRDPPVLIMDEATSEAGSENALLLESAAAEISRNRTTLVVAHRLNQAVVADRILVMEQGEIVEDGRHTELMELNGRYAQLYRRWSAH
ncbi:hypothetical protein CDES_07330 [Corynebacterium deserti GIMN1.010]|uniref:ABC transporter ATP-binding protein n=1 Tax=Corynebacterium deserti GIMN1.010 TaxID=931089 RepID=A0A0M3Q9K9_9CORY|nr:hypothetical protein CDES_07330 [Corynebacterium deserti GIMN1.010]